MIPDQERDGPFVMGYEQDVPLPDGPAYVDDDLGQRVDRLLVPGMELGQLDESRGEGPAGPVAVSRLLGASGALRVTGAVELPLPRLHGRLELRGERLILLPGRSDPPPARPPSTAPARSSPGSSHASDGIPQPGLPRLVETESRSYHNCQRAARRSALEAGVGAMGPVGLRDGAVGIYWGLSSRARSFEGPGPWQRFRSSRPSRICPS